MVCLREQFHFLHGSDVVAMNYRTEDLTGVPEHFPEWFASPCLTTTKFISKYIYFFL